MQPVLQRKRGTFSKTVRLAIRNCIDHNIARRAAALAYYFLFALFPMLIFVSNLLGVLNLDVHSITEALRRILPRDVVELIGSYFDHVADNSSQVLLWFSLVFTVWFPMRAVGGLMDDVRQAYHLGKPKKLFFYTLRQVLFTLVFLLLIILTFLLSMFGRRAISSITSWLGAETINIPAALLTAWQYIRFILVAVLMFVVLGLLYLVAQDKRQSPFLVLPGVLLALTGWLLVSIGFSAYVENFGNYSVIYGTLGAVIVLLVWMYMTAFMLILGAEWNAATLSVRTEQSVA